MQAIKPGALPSLTGIRGVAALWVVFFHIQNVAAVLGLPWLAGLLIVKDGFRGVDLFFLLSGFILMHVHQRDFLKIEARAVLRFAALRVVRVYPLATVVLLLVAAMVLPLPGFIAWFRALGPAYAHGFSALGFVQTALLANRWFMRDFGEFNGPVWSLSVEMIAYATFPVLALMAARARSEILCLAAGLAMLVVLIVFQVAIHDMTANINGRLSIVRGMTCFSAGVALYRAGAFRPGAETGHRWGASVALASTIALLLVLLIPKAAVLAPLCFAGMIMGVRFGRGAIDALLSSRIAIFLGEISFALYLVHLEPLNVLLWQLERHRLSPGANIAALIAYVAAVIPAAFVLHKFVELPAQRYGRRLVARLFERPVPPSAIEQLDQAVMIPAPGRPQ
jgi:peptidoglycan/LPS O-acetylase OafA/YrhL